MSEKYPGTCKRFRIKATLARLNSEECVQLGLPLADQ